MMYPPSYAMDATAGSGGPSTILPQIVTGSPETILAHVTELLQKAQQFTSLIEEFKKAETQLQQAWSGQAADSAVKKIESSLQSFTEIVNVINNGAKLLQSSATMLTTAQTGYTSVVGAVNPTVAGLMSNPYTYSAAVALSTSSSSALRGFITAVGALMKTLGAVNLASELTTVAQIIGQLEQLFNNKGAAATSTTATTTSAPVTAPVAPTSAASAAGAASLANPASSTAATTAAASTSPTSLQTGEQGLLHTPDGKLYTADGQPLLTANGTPAYQNYQPAALTGLPNQAGVAGTPAAAAPAVPTTPAVPTVPAASVPATPAMPTLPAAAATPTVPTASVPTAAVPATPAMPTIPPLSTAGLTTGLGTTGIDPSHYIGTPAAGAPGTDSWIPVDPSQHLLSSGLGTNGASVPVTAPVDTSGLHVPTDASGLTTPTDASGVAAPISHPGGTGDEITVTTVHDGTTTTVEVPMDAHETVTVNAEGTVTVG